VTAHIFRAFLILAVLAVLSACSGKKRVDWKEEVLLKDGSVIVIERSQEYRRAGEPGAGSGWLFDYARLKAQLPGYSEAILWEGSVQPLVLDIHKSGQPYLLATIQTYRGRENYGVSEGTWYVGFTHEAGKWVRISLNQFPRDLRPNLLASTGELFITQREPSGSLVRLNTKQQLDSRPTLPEYYKKLVNLK